jgi:hypothetical protein
VETPFLPVERADPESLLLPPSLNLISFWNDIGQHSNSNRHIGDTFGTVGSLLKVSFGAETINVVQTTAHVPFVNLNMADCISGNLNNFNNEVKCKLVLGL